MVVGNMLAMKKLLRLSTAIHKGVQGVARKLIRAALQEAATKGEMRYNDLKKIEKGIRRHFHDDITVIVVFLDHREAKFVKHGNGEVPVMVDIHFGAQDGNVLLRNGKP